MKKATAKKNSPGLTFIKVFLIAFALILIVATPVTYLAQRALETHPGGADTPILQDELDSQVPESHPFYDAFNSAEKVNILLLGVNQGLTDTIMLVLFDTKAKHLDVISVPRDTYYYRVGFESEAQRKLNAAYRGNPVNTAKAVSEILAGAPINYYVVIDYKGVEKIVDSMGGVPMDIPFNMVYNDPYDKPPLSINIPKGNQVLNGKKAVQFLRFRKGDDGYPGYPEGDIGRIKAQQQFMKNAFKQALGFELPKVARTVYDNLTSDIDLKTALWLATKAAGITADDITTYMMPGTPLLKSPYYVYPNDDEISAMIAQIYGIEPPAPPEQGTSEETPGN